jgi:hypothetical protein
MKDRGAWEMVHAAAADKSTAKVASPEPAGAGDPAFAGA